MALATAPGYHVEPSARAVHDEFRALLMDSRLDCANSEISRLIPKSFDYGTDWQYSLALPEMPQSSIRRKGYKSFVGALRPDDAERVDVSSPTYLNV